MENRRRKVTVKSSCLWGKAKWWERKTVTGHKQTLEVECEN
jgi:hypothetical protein